MPTSSVATRAMTATVQKRRPHLTALGRFLASLGTTILRLIADLSPRLFNLLNRLAEGAAAPAMKALSKGILEEKDTTGSPLPGVWLSLPGSSGGACTVRSDTLLVWLPGGGFVVRSPTATPVAVSLLPRIRALLDPEEPTPPMLVVNYKLPAAADKTIAAVEDAIWQGAEDHCAKKVIVSGDSAGGHLAVVLGMRAAAGQGPLKRLIVGAVGWCPWLDLTLSSKAWEENWYCDLLSRRWVASGARAWVSDRVAAGEKLQDALVRASPNLSKEFKVGSLQPDSVFFVIGQWDRLRDDATAFMKLAPGVVRAHVVDDGIVGSHDGMILNNSPAADAAFDAVAQFCVERMHKK